MTLLAVENLSVHVGHTCLLQPISFAIAKGERLTILGQTGSGKSLLAHAIMGNLPSGLHSQGRARLAGQDMGSPATRRALWGRQISSLPQEPWNALDPLMPAVKQLAETYQLVNGQPLAQARESADYRLSLQGLSESRHKRVGQLSGGMAQRLAIACAMAGGAPVLIADEPTKGLDVSRRDQVVTQLRDQTEQGALITITHDVAVARQLGGRLMVMREGQLLESGPAEAILDAPQHHYTRTLIEADPRNWMKEAKTETTDRSRVLSTHSLSIGRGQTTLLSNLSIELRAGEVTGILGDSGCGKSTLGDTLLGLHAPLQGQVLRHQDTEPHRWQKLYQDPTASVSKAVSLQQLLDDLIERHELDRARIAPLMKRLELDASLLQRNADAVSGGELQRFCLLRVLLLDPVFLFADEPTSRLDPVTAKSVNQLLVEVCRESGCALVLVSHDPDLIEKLSDQVLRLT